MGGGGGGGSKGGGGYRFIDFSGVVCSVLVSNLYTIKGLEDVRGLKVPLSPSLSLRLSPSPSLSLPPSLPPSLYLSRFRLLAQRRQYSYGFLHEGRPAAE